LFGGFRKEIGSRACAYTAIWSAMKIPANTTQFFVCLVLKKRIIFKRISPNFKRLSQLTGGFIGDDEGGTPQNISRAKLNALSDILEEAVQEGKKLVIIARFVAEIKAICKLLEKQGIGYSLIIGGVTDRVEQVSRFQTDPDVQVFVGQIATAGLGITLTGASTLVFYSTDYSMSNHEQAKDRIHRVGQHENCTYIYLSAKGTVDERVLTALHDKADLARLLVDDYRQGRNPYA